MVEARTEGELAEAVRSAYEPLLVLAGGSNVVVADERRSPAPSCACCTRGVERDGDAAGRSQAGEPWDDARRALRRRTACRASSACPGIPGSTGATPIQNVGAYGQEVAETVESVRVLDRASGADRRAVRRPSAASRYRSSVFKYRDRHVVLAVTLPAARVGRLRPAALRRAGARARRARRRQRAAGRGARGGARAAPRQGHGDRPRRPRLGQRRLVLHQPDPRARRLRALRRAPATPPARVPGARRPDQDLGGVADRARRLPRAATATAASASRPSTRSRSSTAAARPPPS